MQLCSVRPCAQGRCGRYPPGSGVTSDLFFLVFFNMYLNFMHVLVALTACNQQQQSRVWMPLFCA